MPSAPMVVVTAGTPYARLVITLPLIPAPYRSGAMESRAPANIGRRSATGPAKRTLSLAMRCSRSGTCAPMTVRRISGNRLSTN